jgi:hypothetical protein
MHTHSLPTTKPVTVRTEAKKHMGKGDMNPMRDLCNWEKNRVSTYIKSLI